MTIDIEKLKRLAEAATPGPWVVDGDTDAFTGGPHVMTEDGAGLLGMWDGQYEIDSDAQEANAAYIAAANPAAILELIRQRDELLVALKALDSAFDSCYELTPDVMRQATKAIANAEKST